jgi:hypothetical protein
VERLYGFSRIPATGAPAPSCTVTVYDAGTANLSTIFADDLASPTPKANPTTADSSGFWFFYASAGRYDIVFSDGGIPAPYTLADVPSGLGRGSIEAFTQAGLPATGPFHAGRLFRVTDGKGGVWIDDGTDPSPVLDYAFSSYDKAGLPAAGSAGRLRRVTDEYQGFYVDDGVAWTPLLAYGLAAATKAGLPAASLAGRLRRVSDDARGVWMDTGSLWFGVGGEVVNVVEFGAVRDGSTDDSAAIQAAIDVLTSGGVVVFPKGTYAVDSPIKVRTGVTLLGLGATILGGTSFSDDALIRTFRRDDNTPGNEDEIGIENLSLTAPASPPNTFYGIDLTGACNSRLSRVRLTGVGSGESGEVWTAIRLAENNPGATSSKRCQNNILSQIRAAGWDTFLAVEQDTADRCTDNVLIAFEAATVRTGLDLSDVVAGKPRLVLLSGQLVGDSDVASTVLDAGSGKADRVLLLGVEASSFNVVTGYHAPVLFNERLGVGSSGTSDSSATAQSGTVPQDFLGSAYLKISSGTTIAAGENSYVYTLSNAGAGAAFVLAPVSGIPSTPIALQGSLSGTTLTVKVVAAAAVTLSSDFVFRAIQVAP